MQSVAATEAKNRFGRMLRQLVQTNEPLLIRRDGKPVAVMLSVTEYEKLQGQLITHSVTQKAQAAFGMWRDRDEIDDAWLADGRNQWQSKWQDDDASL